MKMSEGNVFSPICLSFSLSVPNEQVWRYPCISNETIPIVDPRPLALTIKGNPDPPSDSFGYVRPLASAGKWADVFIWNSNWLGVISFKLQRASSILVNNDRFIFPLYLLVHHSWEFRNYLKSPFIFFMGFPLVMLKCLKIINIILVFSRVFETQINFLLLVGIRVKHCDQYSLGCLGNDHSSNFGCPESSASLFN